VKELSWCTTDSSSVPNKRNKEPITDQNAVIEESSPQLPSARFGIIAAMAKNRIIGVNGELPWTIPKDREIFERVTKHRVIIIGRRVYDETPNGTCVSHVRWCIIVSTTAKETDYDDRKVKIARSFPEALVLAKTLATKEEGRPSLGRHDLDCWVGGGERIYEEALRHSLARELHLSVVDTEIETSDTQSKFTLFPAKYRWDHIFKEESRLFVKKSEEDNVTCDSYSFTYYVYKRKKAITCAGVV